MFLQENKDLIKKKIKSYLKTLYDNSLILTNSCFLTIHYIKFTH